MCVGLVSLPFMQPGYSETSASAPELCVAISSLCDLTGLAFIVETKIKQIAKQLPKTLHIAIYEKLF